MTDRQDNSGIDVDALAQEIRRVDGGHSLGAGALAEALAPYLASLSPQRSEPAGVGDALDQIAYSRWFGSQSGRRPSLIDAYVAGRQEGYALGRRVAEMTAEIATPAPAQQAVTDTWFGPDSSGGWYVKHGEQFFYARHQEMMTPARFSAMQEATK